MMFIQGIIIANVFTAMLFLVATVVRWYWDGLPYLAGGLWLGIVTCATIWACVKNARPSR